MKLRTGLALIFLLFSATNAFADDIAPDDIQIKEVNYLLGPDSVYVSIPKLGKTWNFRISGAAKSNGYGGRPQGPGEVILAELNGLKDSVRKDGKLFDLDLGALDRLADYDHARKDSTDWEGPDDRQIVTPIFRQIFKPGKSVKVLTDAKSAQKSGEVLTESQKLQAQITELTKQVNSLNSQLSSTVADRDQLKNQVGVLTQAIAVLSSNKPIPLQSTDSQKTVQAPTATAANK